MSSQDRNLALLFFGVIFVVLFLSFRPLAIMVLIFFLLSSVAAGIIYGLNHYQKIKETKVNANSVNGIIDQRIEQCNQQIEKNNQEIKDIRGNIRDLEFRLNQAIAVNQSTRTETLKVIEGFKKELSLRETKISFYNTCKKKLSTLLYNYNLTQELAKKKEKLSELQEDNFESLAEMETMKSDMSYDFSYVETISDLSSRMMSSNSLDYAKELQVQLVEMTGELNDI